MLKVLWLFHSCTERELCVYSGGPRKANAAVWADETRNALESIENLPRNEKRPAVDLSMPGVNCLGRQS